MLKLLLSSSSSSSAIFFMINLNSSSSPSTTECIKFKTREFYTLGWLYEWHFCFCALGVPLFRFPQWCRSIENKKSILLEMLSDFQAFCSHDWRVLLLPSFAASADRTHPPSIWLHTSTANTEKWLCTCICQTALVLILNWFCWLHYDCVVDFADLFSFWPIYLRNEIQLLSEI